jgi:prepilin-type N-terminal cleavage/methylation domain-containing protein
VKRSTNAGFTLIEALIVIAISLVLAGIAIPSFTNAMSSYRLSAATSAVAGAIESTRFQAIMYGCQTQLVFTAATMSYQAYSEVPASTATGCLTSFSAIGTAIPLPSVGPITMSGTSFTYTFFANGIVTSVASPSGTSLQLQNSVKSNTITVSGVGNVSTSSP